MEERMLQPDGNGAAVAELESLRSRIDAWLVKDEGSGRFQIDREAFTDADVFALELKYIFERNWVFIAHESQVAKPNDFLTTFIGSQPVILTRDRAGELHCLRSEEHTSELQSLMRISYAVFCLKNKTHHNT